MQEGVKAITGIHLFSSRFCKYRGTLHVATVFKTPNHLAKGSELGTYAIV